MASRKTTLFYAVLLSVASLAVGMIIASRLDLSPPSSAQSAVVPPMNSAPISGPFDASTFRNIAKAAEPIVVNIRTESRQPARDLNEFFGGGDDLFRRFFGQPGSPQDRMPREQVAVAAGSGFIISRDGLILTNNHVVEGATKIEVSLYGDDAQVSYRAKVIGRDQLTDSALIELVDKPKTTLPEARFGDSSQMQPGDWVMAIGNPFNLAHTVSVGVISAVGRPFPTAEGRSQEVLQTDAAINPGNSGGPLLNLRGEVIGINTAIYSNQSTGNIGIGFAVPINVVRELLPQLRTGKVTRGRIGVQVTPVSPDALEEFGLKERRGALVASVEASGPAGQAGVRPGDVILEFNGKPIAKANDLPAAVAQVTPGAKAPLKVWRNKSETSLDVTVGELPNERVAQAAPEAAKPQGRLGVAVRPLSNEEARALQSEGGLVVQQASGPAAKAGLRAGDVIVAVNGQPTRTVDELRKQVNEAKGKLAVLVERQGQRVFVPVDIG